MKKALLFLALPLFFIQCSPNSEDLEEEEQQEKIENLTISITIEGDLLNENREKILYISNKEGKIEGQISLLNNQRNSLTIEKEPNTEYTAIIHDKISLNGSTSHNLNIFESISSADYTIKARSRNSGTNGDLPKVDLYIVNTGNLSQLGMTGDFSSTLSNENGGTFMFNGICRSKPGDFYSSFIKDDEPFARYFWTENVEEDKSFSLNYEELPIAPVVETQLPEHVSASVFVFGYTPEPPAVGHYLSYGSTQGIQTYKTYLPEEDIFENISFNVSYYDGTTSYSYHSISVVIPSSISLPPFDFSIDNFSIEDIDYVTTGNYDLAIARFIISEGNTSIQVNVNLYSEPKSEVSFSIDTLINSLFENVPSFDAAQLEPINITLSSYDYLENYNEAVKELIELDGSLPSGKFRETVSKK